MNSGEYIAVVLVLCGIVVFVLADKLIAVRRTVGRQEVIINHQIGDMKRMIAELESWEKCLHLIFEDKPEEVLLLFDEKILRAESERRHWEVRRLKKLKRKFVEKLQS